MATDRQQGQGQLASGYDYRGDGAVNTLDSGAPGIGMVHRQVGRDVAALVLDNVIPGAYKHGIQHLQASQKIRPDQVTEMAVI